MVDDLAGMEKLSPDLFVSKSQLSSYAKIKVMNYTLKKYMKFVTRIIHASIAMPHIRA